MRLRGLLSVFYLVTPLVAEPALAFEPFEISVKAFTPAGAPIGEQTATCSIVTPCRMSWPLKIDTREKRVTLVVKEAAPGILEVRADQGLETLMVESMPNKRGAAADMKAVKSARNRPAAELMKFQVTRR